jgi:hypothetical protein
MKRDAPVDEAAHRNINEAANRANTSQINMNRFR